MKVCANCRWLENLPFSDEYICANEESEYADCPTNYPNKNTCDEWEKREDGEQN